MKKLILATFAIVNTACAHPHHDYYRPYVVRPPVYYGYECAPYYAPPAPVYYNSWGGCNNWNYNRSFCAPPVIGYGFSFNSGRSFGRVWVR